jgi:DNA-directed RNA polymerase subunit L
MQVKILKRDKKELKIEVEGAGHTLCNLLQGRLLEDENVDVAGYDVPHPLASNPTIYVHTNGTVRPETAIKNAIEKARDINKDFGKELAKALKKKT